MSTLQIIFFIAYGISAIFIGVGIAKKFFNKPPKPIKKPQKDFPNCKCTDPQYCEIWCIAKARYVENHG